MESAAELIHWGCCSNSEFYEGFITLQYWAVSSCLQQQGGRVYVVIWEGGDMYLVSSGLFTVYNGLAAYSRPAPLLPICVLLCIKCPHSFYSLSLSAVISPDCPEPGCHLQMVSAPLSTHWPWWPPGGAANMGNMTTTYSGHHQWAPPREMLMVMISPGCFWQINSSVYCLHIVPGTKHCCSVVTVLTAVYDHRLVHSAVNQPRKLHKNCVMIVFWKCQNMSWNEGNCPISWFIIYYNYW